MTENTRASYPIHYIDNARIPCLGPHPKNLILLCCDAFGVLPPVSRLTKEQAMYHFISGYTAKVGRARHAHACGPFTKLFGTVCTDDRAATTSQPARLGQLWGSSHGTASYCARPLQ